MAVTILLGIAAINTGNNLIYLVVSVLLALLLVSGFFGKANLAKLDVQIRLPEEIYARTEFLLPITLTNRRRFLPVFLMRVRIGTGEAFFPYVDPKGETTKYIPMVYSERGAARIDRLYISSVFPFNFFVRYGWIAHLASWVVYPHPLPCEFWGQFAKEGSEGSDFIANFRGEGTDILSFRNYLEGDPLKYIDWKASAKTGSLKTREVVAPASQPIIIDMNDLHLGGLEMTVSCVTYVILKLLKKNKPVGLKIGGKFFSPTVTKNHKLQMLKELAFWGREGEEPNRH